MNIKRPALDAACLAVMLGHKAHVRACAFSSKGDRIVSGDANGIVKVWDAITGDELLTAGTPGNQPLIRSCGFSPDGARVDVYFDNDAVECWDASTGNRLPVFDAAGYDLVLLGVSSNRSRAVAAGPDGMVWLWEIPSGEQIEFLGERKHCGLWMFSRDGSRIVSSLEGHALNLWSAVTGTLIATLANTDYPVAFSRRGDRLATMPIAGTLRMWDTADGRELAGDLSIPSESPRGHTSHYRWNPRPASFWDVDDNGPAIASYAFSPDGGRVAAISTGGDLTLVNARNGHNLGTVDVHEAGLNNGCLFAAGGATLLSWDRRTFKLWDVTAGEEPVTFEGPAAGLTMCDFSPDGKRIVSCGNDRALRVWDATQRPALMGRTILPGRVLFSDFSPDGNTILHAAGSSLILWDAQTLAERSCQPVHEGPSVEIRDCAWTGDGARVLAAAENEVTLWSEANMLAQLRHTARVEACAISPNGQRIVSCDMQNQVALWDASTGQLIRADRLLDTDGPLAALAFSPDGTMIVAATLHAIKVLDAATGADVALLRGLPGRVPVWAHDPGLRLVSVSTAEEGSYETRDILTGAEVETHDALRFAAIEPKGSPFRNFLQRNMAVSPDGTCLARWGLRKDAERPYALELDRVAGSPSHMILDGHDDAISTCRFSKDGAYLASASRDETLRIWEVATGLELSVYWAESFSSCAWSPDGRTLIAGGYHGGVHVLRLEGSEIVSAEAVSRRTGTRPA